MSNVRRVHILVSGMVQGVFFRHSARQLAEKLGLVGWIRNNPDGTVEALAQGEKKSLEEFIAWCKKGPSASQVEKVDIEWDDKQGDHNDFEILR